MLSERISANGWLWDSVPTPQYNFCQYQPQKGQLLFAEAMTALRRMHTASLEVCVCFCACLCLCIFTQTRTHTPTHPIWLIAWG